MMQRVSINRINKGFFPYSLGLYMHIGESMKFHSLSIERGKVVDRCELEYKYLLKWIQEQDEKIKVIML